MTDITDAYQFGGYILAEVLVRFLLLLGGVFGGFGLSLLGWEILDNSRWLQRAALIGSGFLLNGVALALWWAVLVCPRWTFLGL